MLAFTKVLRSKIGHVEGRSSQQGFTMVEIVLVIALMGGLIAYLMNTLMTTSEEAKRDESKIAMSIIGQSLQMYKIHNNRYPTTSQGLGALTSDPGSAKAWRGPYIEGNKLRDPWDEDFTYESDGRTFKISTGGPDLTVGNEDDVTYPAETKQ